MSGLRHARLGVGIVIAMVAGLAPTAAAQSGKEVAESLCGALSPGEVRRAFDVKMKARQEAYACYWRTADTGDPERGLVLSWHHVPSFEALKALVPEDQELLIADRPALWDAVGNTLSLDLEQGVLSLTGTDLQGTDWQGALTTLGESVVAGASDLLAPPSPDPGLLALVPASVAGQALDQTWLWVDKEFPAKDGWSGDELRKALKQAGRKASDVSFVRAQMPDFSGYVSALQVKGGAAADFAPALATHDVGKGWTADPATFSDGTVTVVQGSEGQVTDHIYPFGDVVWLVRAEEPVLGEFLAALPGAPTLPQPGDAAPPDDVAEPPDDASTAASVVDLIPTNVGGEELTVQSMQGSGGGFSDPKSRVYKALTAGLKSQGKTTDDITIAAAQGAGGELGIIGIEVDGADATAFVDFAVETVLSSLPSRKHKKEPAELAGKAATLLRPQQAMGRVFYIYPRGDIVWIVGGPDAVLEEIFTALP
jgi:hypothetical protein